MPHPGDETPGTDPGEVHIDTDRARAGSTNNVVRYVLVISLLLAIAGLSAVWITGAATSPQGSHEDPVTNQPTPAR